MRSALAPILSRPRNLTATTPADTPVAYTRRGGYTMPLLDSSSIDAQLRTFETVPAVYACALELAEATAQVDWHLYRSSSSGHDEDRVEITNAGGGHAALDLWAQPNPFMDRTFFLEYCQLHFDLAGEVFVVIGTDQRAPGLPLSLWPVIPSMMTPIPDPKRFLKGYVYTDPDGTKVPFLPEEVIHLKSPNPRDPYRGLSPILALMTDLDASRFAAEFNRTFFLNSAEPGGIIEVTDAISDTEFDQLAARWAETHQGVGNSHRVAILTNGMRWVDRSFSMRDIQFRELQDASDSRIMLAFRMGKTLLGQTEGVNRATAEAAEYVFGKYRIVRRLNRWRQVLNQRLLPMFATGATLEFDYENPVTANVEEDAKDRDSRIGAAVALIGAGFDPVQTLVAFDLPEIPLRAPEPADETMPALPAPADDDSYGPRDQAELVQKIYLGVGAVITWEEARQVLREAGMDLPDIPPPDKPAAAPALPAADPARQATSPATPAALPSPAGDQADTAHDHNQAGETIPAALTGRHQGHTWPVRAWNATTDPPRQLPPDELPDVTPLQGVFDRILTRLLDDWARLEDTQKTDLVAKVRKIAEEGSLADLTGLSVDTADTVAALEAAMTEIGDDAAAAVVAEAAAQGVKIKPRSTPKTPIRDVATVVASIVAARLVTGAAAAAMRANGPNVTAAHVASRVRAHLDGLSTDGPKLQLSGALTGAQNDARIETLRTAPEGAIYASEVNDSNTCGPCREIDGKWLGNISDLDEIENLYPGGAYGGYVDCEGRERCRGTITGVWRS